MNLLRWFGFIHKDWSVCQLGEVLAEGVARSTGRPNCKAEENTAVNYVS